MRRSWRPRSLAELPRSSRQPAGGPRDQVVQQQIEALQTAFDSVSSRRRRLAGRRRCCSTRAPASSGSASPTTRSMPRSPTARTLSGAACSALPHPRRRRCPRTRSPAPSRPTSSGPPPRRDAEARSGPESRAARTSPRSRVERERRLHRRDRRRCSAGSRTATPRTTSTSTPLADASAGDMVGPIKTDGRVRAPARSSGGEATDEGPLLELLRSRASSDEAYREYVRSELLPRRIGSTSRPRWSSAPTSRSAASRRSSSHRSTGLRCPRSGSATCWSSPMPGARGPGRGHRRAVGGGARRGARGPSEPRASRTPTGTTIAEEHSDDTGSRRPRRRPRLVRPGELRRSSPSSPAALAELEVGEVSEPVRTEFGYHIIQKTGGAREPAGAGRRSSSSSSRPIPTRSRERGGGRERGRRPPPRRAASSAGWHRYQLSRRAEDAVFALAEVGDVSDIIDPVAQGLGDLQLFKLQRDRGDRGGPARGDP